MNGGFITIHSQCLKINEREYKEQLSFASSRIRQDKKIELDMKQEYSGRELYEMIQNADDEGSPKIELQLTDDGSFYIKNWGERPFTEGGLLSIMRSFLSPKNKNTSIKPIGNKGLGFRSLLNWSNEIIIHSNGVKCSFSQEIAQAAWDELKECMSKNESDQFENERGGLPLPILSIPAVEKDNITKRNCFNENGDCTTDIEVRCSNNEVQNDIAKKLRTLPCSVLLFLRNIKKIGIKLPNGEERNIKVEECVDQGDGVKKITIYDSNAGRDKKIEFIVCSAASTSTSTFAYEVGVAYPAYPLDSIKQPRVLYSYFPTRVRLDVPAIYHGTFELDASRNYLVDSEQNKEVLQRLGEVALKLSCYIAKEKPTDVNVCWKPFEILNLPKADIEAGRMQPLLDSIKEKIGTAAIFPTISGEYKTLDNALWLNEKCAEWLAKNSPFAEKTSMHCHLIANADKVFSQDKCLFDLLPKKEIADVAGDINDIAGKKMEIPVRAELIDVMVSWYRGAETRLDILVDADGNIIPADDKNPAYVLSIKDNTVLPVCLNIRSVDKELIEELHGKWHADSVREVTKRLQNITTVRDGDHTAIRKIIERWSNNDMKNVDDMYEVLKWEYTNPTKDSTPFSSDLQLMNRSCKNRYACKLLFEPGFPKDMAEKIDDGWWLYGNLAEWRAKLGAENDADVADFIHNVLGVSCRVPSEHIYYGTEEGYFNAVRDSNNITQINNYYCDNFGDGNHLNKQYNYSFVPCEEFLNKFELCEALELMLNDKRVLDNILDKNISLFFRKIKSETVQYSYSAYCLRKYDMFKPIQNMVLRSSLFSGGVDYGKLNVDTVQIDSMLVALGAHTSIYDFPIENLYRLLAEKGDSIGVQKRYRDLRKAIISKNASDDVLKDKREAITKVWARKGGILQWRPVDEVYYWDNDQLPKAILSNLPKLEIGSRVGEDSVKKIFGVKLAKDIKISFQEPKENEALTEELRIFLADRVKYLLAYRIGDDVKDDDSIKQFVSGLKSLGQRLHVYDSAKYSFNDEAPVDMKDGDLMVSCNNEYHICSNYKNCAKAIADDPVFCENIKEVLCMELKVTSSTMSNYFRSVISNNLQYLEYIVKKDVTPETWEKVLKSLGLNETERRFWEKYGELSKSEVDISKLSEYIMDSNSYVSYIRERFKCVVLPDNYTGIADLKPCEQYRLIGSMNEHRDEMIKFFGCYGLKAYYMEYFSTIRNRYFENYRSLLYKKCSESVAGKPENALDYIKNYQSNCQEFCGPFYETVADGIKYEYVAETDLKQRMNEIIETTFGINASGLEEPRSCENPCPKTILPEYEKILTEYHLSEGNLDQTTALVAKFRGLGELFRNLIVKGQEQVIPNIQTTVSSVAGVEIDYPENWRSTYKNDNSKKNTPKRKGKQHGGYLSDSEKYRSGKNAELATYEAMLNNQNYEDVHAWSTILNKEGGDDSLHYDISYRKKGTSDTRYLEVKAMNGDSIIMSGHEYDFAREHCEQYDFAIFHDGIISIIESPFGKEKNWDVKPDSYRIVIEKNG